MRRGRSGATRRPCWRLWVALAALTLMGFVAPASAEPKPGQEVTEPSPGGDAAEPPRASAVQAYVPLAADDGLPFSPLALAGREVFVREGCATCHSVAAWPAPEKVAVPAEELVPIPARPRGPDLARVGGKYPELWHVYHLTDPRLTTPGSVMPAFATILGGPLRADAATRAAALASLVTGGAAAAPAAVQAEQRTEAAALAARVREQGGTVTADTELVAVIAYLQQLGRGAAPEASAAPAASPADEAAFDAALLAAVPSLAAEGAALYSRSCVACHGAAGEGHIGPPLTDDAWRFGGSPSQVVRSIAFGNPSRGMPAWGPVLGDAGVRAVAAHVIGALAHGSPASPRPPASTPAPAPDPPVDPHPPH